MVILFFGDKGTTFFEHMQIILMNVMTTPIVYQTKIKKTNQKYKKQFNGK